jgi:hypothetical protein
MTAFAFPEVQERPRIRGDIFTLSTAVTGERMRCSEGETGQSRTNEAMAGARIEFLLESVPGLRNLCADLLKVRWC